MEGDPGVSVEGGTRPARARPRCVSSARRVRYRRGAWRVHQFEVWGGGEALCRCVALRLQDSLLLWLGAVGAPGAAALGEVALGMPRDGAGGALASTLLGAGGDAAALARRLAAALRRPVYVCCGAAFDRFTAPLVERALVAEIKSRPECF